MTYFLKKLRGVTLIEIMLVLVIISSILVAFIQFTARKSQEIRRDRAVMQMQQVLNAGLANYVNYSAFNNATCGSSGCILDGSNSPQTNGFLPNVHIKNPWGGEYIMSYDTPGVAKTQPNNFSVCMQVPASSTSVSTALAIAGQLPNGFTSSVVSTSCIISDFTSNVNDCTAGNSCTVITAVGIPGQNLNNARSVNFAGVYSQGGCVPAPACPAGMTAAIFLAPVAIRGLYDGGTSTNVYPISSFAVRAVGNASQRPIAQPPLCNAGTPGTDCASVVIPSPLNLYWRVCIDVVTSEGPLSTTNMTVNAASVLAVTRCVPSNEPFGSGFSYFNNN